MQAAAGMADARSEDDDVFNILPLHNTLADHAAMRFPEVRAAIVALRAVGHLSRPPSHTEWRDGMDILDWLGSFFGFQADNIKNQREHLTLLLANAQMRANPQQVDKMEGKQVSRIRRKLTKNYLEWCNFLEIIPAMRIVDGQGMIASDERLELLYTSLFLLIWGEAANLRFMPECLCYMYHHMCKELNNILDDRIDEKTGQSALPATCQPGGFMRLIVKPLYKIVSEEAKASEHGKAPYSAWRNYDDMNEFFWNKSCFIKLGWPLDQSSNYLVSPQMKQGKQKVTKTGFVERRSFWSIFHSFDRLWTGLILFLQASIIVSWNGNGAPWTELKNKDQLARVLSIFITWSALRGLQAVLNMVMHYKLVTNENRTLGLRMVLKVAAAAAWIVVFSALWSSLWSLRKQEGVGFDWTPKSNNRLRNVLYAAAAFLIPEALALLLFIIPWIRNFVENSNWRIFHLLTWWFQNRMYVARGLREGIFDNLRYSLFWIVVVGTKFAFSYVFQIRPLIKPTKEILNLSSDEVHYLWHEYFGHGNRIAVLAVWAPVLFIYFMDLQIWYTVYSSLVGALVGLFDHLGEIRNIGQIKQRFQYFASALQFALMAEDNLMQNTRSFWQGKLWTSIKNARARFQLRFGLIKNPGQIEAGRFMHIWNEIMAIFREEDLVSDRELELLEVPPSSSWGVTVIQWPSFLLSNSILVALGQCENFHGDDKALWRKVSRNEYRRCAVVECFESACYLLLRIVSENTEEHTIIKLILDELKTAINLRTFTKKFQVKQISAVHGQLIKLASKILEWRDSKATKGQVVRALQDLYDTLIRDFPQSSASYADLGQGSNLYPTRSGDLFFGSEDSVVLPERDEHAFYKQLKRVHTTLSTKEAILHVPKGLEAKRRITFFSNSLFMTLPRAPAVDQMLAFSVLTPYYKETVLYQNKDLEEKNEDGITTIFYLQQIYPDDWANFLERMGKRGILPQKIEATDEGLFERRLWASYRGQTLARTVRGMMYYNRALQVLAFLDGASEKDVEQGHEFFRQASQGFGDSGDGIPMDEIRQHHSQSFTDRVFSNHDKWVATAAMKFTYVAACQVYGDQKHKKEIAAGDIRYLMEKYDGLRVAYVDQKQVGKNAYEYYSVLVKYDQATQREVEIYRVQLPGPVLVGEGKPENQNHAFIFTRGDAVQTIDMNQENYFEEALKMRNLLQEFTFNRGIRKPTILGVREHVFTGAVSSLAWFMSAQETSFVTLGQRVLANPLKIRMHYGHPDVFDRLWFLTRGGISKASKVINISEDIFAGFNCTERRGNVTHHEYIQVGKGRDVGIIQIYLFEAKVASGNGEQILSRDVYRLGHRLDFFRMLSFYYTTVGFFISNMLVVLTVYAFLWGRVYLALSGVEASILKLDNSALTASINQQFLVQLGLFTALPMIVENSLEHGFGQAVWEFILMQLQLSSVFFTFSMGTRAHYFGRTILHGGAKYRATGRGFVVTHEKFAENYRVFSRSHFVKALELVFLLVVYEVYGGLSRNSSVYVLVTFSSWFLALSWIMAPFLFNPSGFDWLKTVEDVGNFSQWIFHKDGQYAEAKVSWERWWEEEQAHLQSTGIIGKIVEIILSLRFLFFQYGIVYRLRISDGNRNFYVYLLSWTYVIAVGAFVKLITWAREKYSAKQHGTYRFIQLLSAIFVLTVIVLLAQLTKFSFSDVLSSLLAFLPTGWALLQIAQVLRHPFVEKSGAWPTVVALARLYEYGMGLAVLLPVAFLSWLPGFQAMQTRILFNEAFSRGLQIQRILTGKNPNAIFTS